MTDELDTEARHRSGSCLVNRDLRKPSRSIVFL